MPPMTSPVYSNGMRSLISSGVTTSTRRPNTCAMDALRFSSSKRSSAVAIDTDPHCR